MNDAQTIERLYDLRLEALAEAFSAELARTGDPALSFAERFGMLVDASGALVRRDAWRDA